jgi:hypothetical protein
MGSRDFNLVAIGGRPAGLSRALAAAAFYVDMLRAYQGPKGRLHDDRASINYDFALRRGQ